jgi:hypothetical protein
VGDDANPCSRTAPCKTFAGAISKTAAGGEIDVLDPGGFGGLTITKAITIDGTPVVAGVLVSGTNGITISAGASDVVILRGLDINGIGGTGSGGLDGVAVTQAGKVTIEDCQIYGFSPRDVSVAPTANPVQVFINHTRIKGSLSNGVVINPTAGVAAHVTLDDVQIVENTNYGLSVTGGGSVVVRNSIISDNAVGTSFAAIRVDGTLGAATVEVDNTVISGSPNGILSINGAAVSVNNSGIINNGTGLSASGGSILTFGNNRLAGNGVNGSFTGNIGLQ